MPVDDPYKYFRIEAAELLERLGHAALEIDKGMPVQGGVAALLRYAHTLKGAARVVKQTQIADRAHAIEDLLAPHRGLVGHLPKDCGRGLRAQVDAISELTALLGPGQQSAASGSHALTEPARTLRADLADVDAVVDGVSEALVELESLKATLGALDRARLSTDLLMRQLAAPRRTDPAKLAAVLDRAARVSEELGAGLRRAERGLQSGFESLARSLGETHNAAEALRLVPAASIFVSLERAARDAALELGKRVEFSATGGDVKLHGHVLDAAHGALSHVVRNAVAHGLEPERERLRAGKPAVGRISLTVSRRGRNIVFGCRDDGSGVDTEALRRALAASGKDAGGLSEAQLLEELLRAGVSTAPRVTGLSGRGVGLDVLRETAERLGGTARLESQRGLGLQVALCLPLHVAAVPVIAAVCEGRTVAVPLAAVVETVRVSSADITLSGGSHALCRSGQVLPFAPLSTALGLASAARRGAWSALVVRCEAGTVAVGVDRLLGMRSVALRPLPEAARARALIAGASLDALGNPELVLDPDGLVREIQRASGVRASAAPVARPILVVDDSLTTRMLEQSILESAGYEVDLATSGEEGLVKARARPYALFLVDVEMPGIDGFAFIDRARTDPQLSNVPAVLVSSRAEPEDFQRGKAVGARGYIVKGRFDQRELLGLIEELVQA